MYVLKRKGHKEKFDISKIRKVAEFAVEGYPQKIFVNGIAKEGYTADRLINHALNVIKDGITTKRLQMALVRSTSEMTSTQEPLWQYIAAKLLVYNAYKEASLARGNGKFGYGNFYDLITNLSKNGRFVKSRGNGQLYGQYILDNYSKEEIEELGNYIKPERDYLFTYTGMKNIFDRYVIKGYDKERLELPQEMFMGIAMHLCVNEENRMSKVKILYDILSELKGTMATPTMSNARKVHHQLSSCFIDTVADDLERIYESTKNFARVSKHGGGMGLYYGKVRALDSDIRGNKGASGGVLPWIKLANETSVFVDQLGVRAGSTTVWLDAWHKDFMDFLNIKTNSGEDRLKSHDVFPGVCYPDLFWRLVKEQRHNKDTQNKEWDAMWHMFCPHEVERYMGYRLEDFWGEEWEEKYWECVNNPNLPRKSVPLFEVVKAILTSAFETGTPFAFFRDTVNRLNPNKHKGMIYCTNLCTEIFQNMSSSELMEEIIIDSDKFAEMFPQYKGMDSKLIVSVNKPGNFVVCNLASTVVARNLDLEDLEKTVTAQIRAMDNVIDLNYYPTPYAEVTNKEFRAIGLGTSGYHHALAKLGISWNSKKHLEFAKYWYSWWSYFAIKASMEIAKEKGPYKHFEGSDWATGDYFKIRGLLEESNQETDFGLLPDWEALMNDVMKYGMRNAYVHAIAPTGSTSNIAGTSAAVDPVMDVFWLEEKKSSITPQTAPELDPSTLPFYANNTAYEVDQFVSIEACGIRQKYIDQGQSFNLYITPHIDVRDFCNMYVRAWEEGLKSIYYVRNQSDEEDQTEDCAFCSA